MCDNCQALVHSEQLDRLASEAKALEAKSDFRQARQRWLMGLPLLPANSRQADWIQSHARPLDALAERVQPRHPARTSGLERLGPVGPIAFCWPRANSCWAQFSSSSSCSAFWRSSDFTGPPSGAKFGIGFAALILIHEMGHYIDIKRRGLPADMPVFLPGFGAYVRWQAVGVPMEMQAEVSLAGPLAGFLASVACAVIWAQTHDPLWAALGRSGAWLNLLNLIPVWMLDGGHAALALEQVERIILLMACLASWLLFGRTCFFWSPWAPPTGFLRWRPSRAPESCDHHLLRRGARRAG